MADTAEQEKEKTFADLGLCDELREVCEKQGWKNPREIQAKAIPCALQGRDLIAISQTGTGKTAAFALPTLQALIQASHQSSRPLAFFACVLAPTRELADQIAKQFRSLGSGIGVKCATLIGKDDMAQQAIALAKRPHIIVATPGRLLDHMKETKGFSLRSLRYLILDEADRLLDDEFEKVMDEILNGIPSNRKTYLFSATMTRKVQKLQRVCLKNPAKIEISSKYSTVETLKQQLWFVPTVYKECYLVYLLHLKFEATTMVFTRTCDATIYLATILRNLGLRAVPINGHLSQSKRFEALNKFKSGQCNILICTDVASRGLDIPSVDMVVNYNIPAQPKDYVHRVGRTARAGRSGLAISLVTQFEVEPFKAIERHLGHEMPAFPTHHCEEAMLVLDRVEEAKRITNRQLKEAGDRKRKGRRGEDEDKIENYLGNKKHKKHRMPKRN
ncbi:DEAD-box ATP-dependent RNA helicase 10 [Turnera subulata]|uniref:DEAD-box ATP-dependent RNA helicase 10 n=1 Tax=Turnera subulata TaxID=218843 RepID=A0A9Q0F7P8_9ROSI|nr:DEAD-box ATP-dependent RNA helicase 10 [Turnera subulata]